MQWRALAESMVAVLANEPDVEGLYAAGSLVTSDYDSYFDLNLGLVSSDSALAFKRAYALRNALLGAVGQPVHRLERRWGHCRMIAALYSQAQFPPIGLEVDLIVSQLRHVHEQMPHTPYQVLWDRSGRLARWLARQAPTVSPDDIRATLRDHVAWFPFYIHDARVAVERGDRCNAQAMLEELRRLVFYAAALRHNQIVYGAKRAARYLTDAERALVEHSYAVADTATIRALADLPPARALPTEAERLRRTLSEFL